MSACDSIQAVMGAGELGSLAQLPGVPLASPTDAQQASELIALATRDRIPFVILGNGSKLGWSVMCGEPRFALSTAQLRGVIEFEPGDGVLSALAGTTMEELERVTAESGLGVTPLVARPKTATLGGVIGAGQSGIDRDQLGASRLHILGTDSLQLDGTRTRSGGRLVKNVSGYDLHRLLGGSFGSLALMLKASLRLFPLPEELCVLRRTAESVDSLLEPLTALRQTGCDPRSALLERPSSGAPWTLHVVLAGRRAPLEVALESAAQRLEPNDILRGSDALSAQRELRSLEPDNTDGDVLHVTTQPSEFRTALDGLLAELGANAAGKIVAQPATASVDVALASESISAARLCELRASLRPRGAHVRLRRESPLTPSFGSAPSSPARGALQERLRQVYDPANLLCTRPPLGFRQ